MHKKSVSYEKMQVIRQVEVVKNLDTPSPNFFYTERAPLLSIGLDFETKSTDEFLAFTHQYIYERLFIFECDKKDLDDLESFLFLCLVLTQTNQKQTKQLETTFKGFNDLSQLDQKEFIEEVSLYVNDHFFEERITIDIEVPAFVSAYKVFKDDFFYALESHSLFKVYYWDRYI